MDVDRFVNYNEPLEGPQLRVLVEFGPHEHAVLLLNERYLELCALFRDLVPWLAGHSLVAVGNILELGLPGHCQAQAETAVHACLKDKENVPPFSAYSIGMSGRAIGIPIKDITVPVELDPEFVPFGLVITGKQFLKQAITRASLIPKNVPTEFVADAYGDSYNESFYKEPRIIETYPSTVFDVIDNIQDIAKAQFAAGNYSAAAAKYQKAYHYGHSFYPEDLGSADLERLTSAKIQSLVNLSLAALKSGDPARALRAATTALEMPEISSRPVQHAKALYRQGSAHLAQGDDQLALADFQAAKALHPDPATDAAIRQCNEANRLRTEKTRNAMRRAFG